MITLQIDNKIIEVPEGVTILDAAKKAKIRIPTLCALEHLSPYGSCRLCIVEIEGKKGYHTSCNTLVEQNMVVRTYTKEIEKLRKTLLELYLSDYDLDCNFCPKSTDCELEQTIGIVGLKENRLSSKPQKITPKDTSNPYFTFDPTKCILCARCVRACEEIQGNFAITLIGRGFNTKVSPGLNDFINSECVSCGACVKACPSAALIENSVIDNGRGTTLTFSTCGFCGVGCSIIVESKGNTIVKITGDDNGPNKGHLCVKGRFAWEFVNSDKRLTKPLLRESLDEQFREVSWEEAIEYCAIKFSKIKAKYGVESLSALASSRCTNEEVYLVQKLVRCAFGNNNIDNCARVCHMPTGFSLTSAFGTGAGTADIESLENADCIMIVGSNTTHAHPVVGALIRKLARIKKQLIVIDPREIELAKSPNVEALHLQVKPSANVALLNAIAHIIVKENLYDRRFIEERCDVDTFKQWLDFVEQEENSPEATYSITRVSPDLVKAAARMYAKSKKATIVYGLGVTEHKAGSTGVFCLTNLAMLTGNIGKPGCGVSPLRGQNNVQGASDMGAFPNVFTFYRNITDQSVRQLFERKWNATLNTNIGLTIPQMFDAAIEGKLKGIYIVGEDVFQTDPNLTHVEKALKSMEFVVVQELFLSPTTKYAHVVLPGSSYLEKDGTFTNWERRISRVRKVIEPLSKMDEFKIISKLSTVLGYPMHYNHPEEIMQEISEVSPQLSALTYQKLENGSLLWPINDLNKNGTKILHEKEFLNKKGKFFITKYYPPKDHINNEYPYLLTTGRNLFHYNSGNQTRRTHNTLFYDSDYLEINKTTAMQNNIQENDLVLVESKFGAVTLKARLSDKIQEGILYTTFHFTTSPVNIVSSNKLDWAVDTPEYKYTPVSIKKVSTESLTKKDTSLSNIEELTSAVWDFFAAYPKEIAINYSVNHIKKNWSSYRINQLKSIKTPKNEFLKDIINAL